MQLLRIKLGYVPECGVENGLTVVGNVYKTAAIGNLVTNKHKEVIVT